MAGSSGWWLPRHSKLLASALALTLLSAGLHKRPLLPALASLACLQSSFPQPDGNRLPSLPSPASLCHIKSLLPRPHHSLPSLPYTHPFHRIYHTPAHSISRLLLHNASLTTPHTLTNSSIFLTQPKHFPRRQHALHCCHRCPRCRWRPGTGPAHLPDLGRSDPGSSCHPDPLQSLVGHGFGLFRRSFGFLWCWCSSHYGPCPCPWNQRWYRPFSYARSR